MLERDSRRMSARPPHRTAALKKRGEKRKWKKEDQAVLGDPPGAEWLMMTTKMIRDVIV